VNQGPLMLQMLPTAPLQVPGWAFHSP
jgi:hypothetical protein